MSLSELIILVLATWRVTILLSEELGVLGIAWRFRRALGIAEDENGRYLLPLQLEKSNLIARALLRVRQTLAGELMCFWCCSLFVSAGWFVFWLLSPVCSAHVATVCALSAGAIWLYSRGLRVRRGR